MNRSESIGHALINYHDLRQANPDKKFVIIKTGDPTYKYDVVEKIDCCLSRAIRWILSIFLTVNYYSKAQANEGAIAEDIQNYVQKREKGDHYYEQYLVDRNHGMSVELLKKLQVAVTILDDKFQADMNGVLNQLDEDLGTIKNTVKPSNTELMNRFANQLKQNHLVGYNALVNQPCRYYDGHTKDETLEAILSRKTPLGTEEEEDVVFHLSMREKYPKAYEKLSPKEKKDLTERSYLKAETENWRKDTESRLAEKERELEKS